MRGAHAKRGTKGLRKRCPICRKLRKFYEPMDGAHQDRSSKPRRKPWVKDTVRNRWVCGWCVHRGRWIPPPDLARLDDALYTHDAGALAVPLDDVP